MPENIQPPAQPVTPKQFADIIAAHFQAVAVGLTIIPFAP
jgi:hypothetical protein